MQYQQEPILQDAVNLNFTEQASGKFTAPKSSSYRPPEHLSEFYSFMSNNSNTVTSPSQRSMGSDYNFRRRVTREPSLNTFTSFSPSVSDLSNIVTSKDFQHTVDTYSNVLDKAENLREAFLTVSKAASEFGEALEATINDCPSVNNSKQVNNGLINAGGLQHIIGANQYILSRLMEQNFVKPLNNELEKLKENYSSNHRYYQQEVKVKTKALREKELENVKLSKSKTRNLNTYKNNLMNLSSHIDDIDRLKYEYYHELNSMIESFNQQHLLVRTGSLVRAQLEIHEGIAKKGWSGGGLDEILAISPDIFGSNFTDDEEYELLDDEDTNNNNISDNKPKLNGNGNAKYAKSTSSNTPDADSTLEIIEENQGDDHSTGSDPIKSNIGGNTPNKEEIRKPVLHNITKKRDTDSSLDESFSLPVINNTNTSRNQTREASDDTFKSDDINIDNSNILNELDD